MFCNGHVLGYTTQINMLQQMVLDILMSVLHSQAHDISLTASYTLH